MINEIEYNLLNAAIKGVRKYNIIDFEVNDKNIEICEELRLELLGYFQNVLGYEKYYESLKSDHYNHFKYFRLLYYYHKNYSNNILKTFKDRYKKIFEYLLNNNLQPKLNLDEENKIITIYIEF